MSKYVVKRRCIRCLSVLDAAGHCTNEKCIKHIMQAETTQQEAAQAAETTAEK